MTATQHVEMNVLVGGDFKTFHPITNMKAVLVDNEGSTLFDLIDGTTPLRIDLDNNLYKKVNGEWVLVNLNSILQIPLGDISALSVSTLNDKVAIRWNDPMDVTITTVEGSELSLAKWEGTKVVIKKGSEPTNPTDGTLVEDVKVKDLYSTTGLIVDSLSVGEVYFIKLFPYTEKGLVTSSSSNSQSVRIGFTPLGAVTGLSVGSAGSIAYLTWSDPIDIDTEFNGEIVPASKWSGTNIVMKAGSYPVDSSDGQLVATTTIRDKYAADSLEIPGLSEGVTYYFALFPYNEQHVESFDANNRGATTIRLPELSTVTDFKSVVSSNTVALTWSDPSDIVKYVNGEEVISSKWKSTVLIRKAGAVPMTINDGVMVKEVLTRDAHKEKPVLETGLTFNTTYYYKLFVISTDGKTSTGHPNVLYVDIPSM